MIDKKALEIMKGIIDIKGKDFIILLVIEEMAELSKELLKNINRKKDNIDDIKEELADVLALIEHVKALYNISDNELHNIINKKIPEKWGPRLEKLKAKI